MSPTSAPFAPLPLPATALAVPAPSWAANYLISRNLARAAVPLLAFTLPLLLGPASPPRLALDGPRRLTAAPTLPRARLPLVALLSALAGDLALMTILPPLVLALLHSFPAVLRAIPHLLPAASSPPPLLARLSACSPYGTAPSALPPAGL